MRIDTGTAATFALASFVFAASPGPDNVTVLSKTVNDGPAHGLACGCGVTARICGFVVMAALGLHAVAGAAGEHLRTSSVLVRYLGAAYLVVTGVRMWRAPAAGVAPRQLRGGLARLFAPGFLLNVANPKMPIFTLALLPGVLGTRALAVSDTLVLAALVMAALVMAVEVVVVGGHVAVALRAKAALSRSRRLRARNRGSGAPMIGADAIVAAR